MDKLVIAPGEDLIETATSLISPRDRDYSHNLVVFPGRRPAHFLRKSLAKREKGSFVPPQIHSMDDFVDYVSDLARPMRSLETVNAVAILHQIHSSAPARLGGDSFLSLDSFFSLGIKIYRDIEELYIEGVPPSMVKEIQPFTDEMVPEHALARLQSLHFFYKTFYDRISKENMATRSMRYRIAADRILDSGIERFERVIFAGFYALTKCEKDLFRKLLPREEAIFIFQDGPGIGERLKDLEIETGDAGRPCREPRLHFYNSPDTHGQAFALGNILKQKIDREGMPDEKTAIVLPSPDTLFPLLRQGMTCLGKDSFNISLGYPMHRTPVFGFLNNLMELIASMEDNKVYVPDYIKFALHPYTKNIYFKGNAETTRIMFHTLEEILRRARTRTFIPLSEIEDNDKMLEAVVGKSGQEPGETTREEVRDHLRMIHLNTIEKFLSFRNIGDFAVKCIELLTFIFSNSTARLHHLFHPFSESLIRLLDTVSRSLIQDMSFTERTSYFTFFRKYIMTGHVPFPGTPVTGLQVLGFLETRNIRFDTVFILDANEDVIPAASREETLLPLKAREILKLPTHLDKDRLSAYYFDNLVRGAREVHIFFVENDSREKSRFVEGLLWEKQKRDRSIKASDYVRTVQYKVKLGNETPADIPKSERVVTFIRDFAYSPTALDMYLKCPLRFYYGYVLNLGKKEEITGDIERADIGKFIHRVLSSYFSRRTNRVLKEADMDIKELENLIDRYFELEYGNDPAGAVYLLKVKIKEHLKVYLRKYYIPLIAGKEVTIIGIEEPVETTLNSCTLKGRMDVIERRDGLIHIVDYKSSSTKSLKIDFHKFDPGDRGSWNKAIGSLQLPFYLLLYSERSGIPVEDLRGMFLLLGRSTISSEIELPLFAPDDEDKSFGGLRTVIFGLLKEILDPAIPFAAASDRKTSCPRCDFQYICGTQWVTG